MSAVGVGTKGGDGGEEKKKPKSRLGLLKSLGLCDGRPLKCFPAEGPGTQSPLPCGPPQAKPQFVTHKHTHTHTFCMLKLICRSARPRCAAHGTAASDVTHTHGTHGTRAPRMNSITHFTVVSRSFYSPGALELWTRTPAPPARLPAAAVEVVPPTTEN